jgi:thiol-disulfide isomerase/thioredoxin
MARRLPPLLLLTSLVAGSVLSGCGGLEGTGSKGYIAGEGQVTEVPVAERGAPIEMSGTTLDGTKLSLADHRGQVVVVNVWWSACPPCRAEMPTLVKAAASEEHPAAYVGIDIRDSDVAQAQAFVRRFEVPYPSVFDPSGKALLAFAGTLSPRTVPSTVVLDPQGRIAASVIGPVPSETTLEELIDDAAGPADG